MSEDRRPLTAEEKAECAALKREFVAWNSALPRKDRISQEKMAAHLQMNQGSFSNYLNGHRPLHIGIAVGVYELMGIPVESYSKRLAAEIARLGKTGVALADSHERTPGDAESDTPTIAGLVDELTRIGLPPDPELRRALFALVSEYNADPRRGAEIAKAILTLINKS